MAQYDDITEEYNRSIEERSDRENILIPTAQYYVGDINGKYILDLGCGSGYFTRLLKNWGAKQVLGVDISSEMIKLAKQKEEQNPLGISYFVNDITKLDKLGEFDIIFAAFLLHYSSSIVQLQMMCKSISKNLKDGGKFIAFNENPFFPVHQGIKYGAEAKSIGRIYDGSKIQRAHYTGDKKDVSFEHYHFEPQTYEYCLESSGLSEVKWKHFISSEQAKNFESNYWQDYLGDFSIAVLLAQK